MADRDAAALGRLRARDHRAFDALYRAYRPRVNAYLALALHNAQDVEDVSQQVFLSLYEALPGYHGEEKAFEHWLLRILRNKAIDHLKRHSSFTEAPELIDRRRELQREVVLGSVIWGTNTAVHGCLEELPHAQRQVLVLHYLLDLTHGEIAEVLGRGVAAVRQVNRRALATLERELLSPEQATRGDAIRSSTSGTNGRAHESAPHQPTVRGRRAGAG